MKHQGRKARVSSLMFCFVSFQMTVSQLGHERNVKTIGLLTNPFSSSVIPGLGTRLLVSSIVHLQVEQAFVLTVKGLNPGVISKVGGRAKRLF